MAVVKLNDMLTTSKSIKSISFRLESEKYNFAVVSILKDGTLFIWSDWGNYSYHWDQLDLTEFISTISVDYILRCITRGSNLNATPKEKVGLICQDIIEYCKCCSFENEYKAEPKETSILRDDLVEKIVISMMANPSWANASAFDIIKEAKLIANQLK